MQKSRRSRHFLDSFHYVDEWLKLQLTAKKEVGEYLVLWRENKTRKCIRWLYAVSIGWNGWIPCHLTLTARTTLSFSSSLPSKKSERNFSMASWRTYMKSAERNSTMKDVCMLAQDTSRTTHIVNIKRRRRRKRRESKRRREKKEKKRWQRAGRVSGCRLDEENTTNGSIQHIKREARGREMWRKQLSLTCRSRSCCCAVWVGRTDLQSGQQQQHKTKIFVFFFFFQIYFLFRLYFVFDKL